MNAMKSQHHTAAPDEDRSVASKSQADKAVEAKNALANGVRLTDPVIDEFESLEDWKAHRDSVVSGLCPVGSLETAYAERAALYLWRLDRVTRYENTATTFDHDDVIHEFMIALKNPDLTRDRSEAVTLEKLREHLVKYLAEFARWGKDAAKLPDQKAGLDIVRRESKRIKDRRIVPDPSTIQTIIKFEGHLQRCLAQTMAELRRLQKERRQGLRGFEVDRQKADTTPRPAPAKFHEQPEDNGRQPVQVKSQDEISPGIETPGNASVSPDLIKPNGADGAFADATSTLPGEESNQPGICHAEDGSAEQAGNCRHAEDVFGSPVPRGESRSQTVSPSRLDSPIQSVSPGRLDSSIETSSPTRIDSPIPRIPPPNKPLTAHGYRISESTPNGIVVRDPSTSGVIITMIPKPTLT